ncbi:tRNA pseudouridine38-40 synthase [Luteibacter sp. Sphag1AF]|uniref:tRNA pseudouridine(38-40) synthase TruA n=1 Tax=Luteibacter sp. Sphag1AF TaxID=2587031 RepID=UPI001607C9D1|nr:tRNA pseudouridine(38-40) synthase TruA [Luteibacter sp. Sphag1AF]MBB3229007.1 tRNA pseudouridine38-40 synthase [Luteibacter sp. Sphag1AF]
MRIALGVEYDGTDFFGWQRLSHASTVQGALESALTRVANHPVEVTASGRTDAGVHGRCQVVHFDTDVVRDMRGWILGACSNLPHTVAVTWAQPVADDFHARFSARARQYRYRILPRMVRPALDARFVAWERRALDTDAMHEAAQALIGEHDFSAFRAIQCQAAHARRNVHSIRVLREDRHVVVEIQANAFLHHMVRNIVGSLLVIGRGEQSLGWMGELLEGRNREVAGATAPAEGLTFLGPRYEAHWGLPAEVTL